MKNKLIMIGLGVALGSLAFGQTASTKAQPKPNDGAAKRAAAERLIDKASIEGVRVLIGQIGGFRGARSNTIMGYGLVVGLNGTGDSSQVKVPSTVMANALSRWGTQVDATNFKAKNIALVSITAEMPPFAAPGRKIDVTVQSIGDAKSLEGGVLLPCPLGVMADARTTYAIATGSVNVGGFGASANGSSVQKNHPTVGRISSGGDVQTSVQTQFVFDGNTLYYDLDTPDFTTSQRVSEKIKLALPGSTVEAIDGVSIKVSLPTGVSAVATISQIEGLSVMAMTPATVVINSRTGTVVVGGNVKLAPAVIAYGALRIRIQTENSIIQPNPLASGTTAGASNSSIDATEDTQIGVITPNATLNDLAKILQSLNLTARDIINIFEALAEQGALKARVIAQ